MWSIYHPRRSEPPECRMGSGRVVLQILGSFRRVRLVLIDLLQFVLMMSCYSFFSSPPPLPSSNLHTSASSFAQRSYVTQCTPDYVTFRFH